MANIMLGTLFYLMASTFDIGGGPRPQKHLYRHQFCDSNYPRTQVMAQNVISKRPLMASIFDIGGGLLSKKKLGLRLSWVEGAQ